LDAVETRLFSYYILSTIGNNVSICTLLYGVKLINAQGHPDQNQTKGKEFRKLEALGIHK